MNDQERDNLLIEIDRKVDGLSEWRAALDERCTAHRGTTEDIKDEVYGNPHGLKAVVSENAQQIKMLSNCKTRLNKTKDFFIFILRSLLTAAIIGLAIWLMSLYKST